MSIFQGPSNLWGSIISGLSSRNKRQVVMMRDFGLAGTLGTGIYGIYNGSEAAIIFFGAVGGAVTGFMVSQLDVSDIPLLKEY